MISVIEEYSQLNSCTAEHGIVIFGQNFFRTFPLGEMAYKAGIHTDIYNRSLSDTTIDKMIESIDVCVTELNPDKVFINIGEVDISTPGFDVDKFVELYHKLIQAINVRTTSDIYVINIMSDSSLTDEVNKLIKKVADEEKAQFVDVGRKPKIALDYLKFFDRIKCYMRDCPITFGEAFS